MPEIRIWRDTPKRGETDGGWFYSRAQGGHVLEVRGGFPSEAAARRAAGDECPACFGEGQIFRHDERDGFEYNHGWDRCEACDGTGEQSREEADDDG